MSLAGYDNTALGSAGAAMLVEPYTFTITTAELDDFVQNQLITSVAFRSMGGHGAITWTATGLPAGLSFSASGVLSGTPTGTGTFTGHFTASDADGHTAVIDIVLRVAPETRTAPWAGKFGLALGNQGLKRHLDPVVDAIQAGGNKLGGIRMDAQWSAFDGNATGNPTWPSGQSSRYDAVKDQGLWMLPMLGYCPGGFQRTLPCGTGSAVSGNTFVTLNSALTSPSGVAGTSPPYPQNSIFVDMTLHGPGITGTVLIAGASGTRINLKTPGGAPYHVGTGSGSYTIGGTNQAEDQKLICADPAAFGNMTEKLIRMLLGRGYKVLGLELSNETNHSLGQRPFCDPAHYFKLICHGVAGAKRANPDIIVSPAGPGGRGGANGTNGAFMRTDDWYTKSTAIGAAGNNTPQRGLLYQADHQNAYWLNVRSDYNVAAVTPDDWPPGCFSVHAYNDGSNWATNPLATRPGSGAMPMPDDVSSVNLFQATVDIHNAMYAAFGRVIPCWFTEQGPHWDPSAVTGQGVPGGDARVASAQESKWWVERLRGICSGDLAWPTNGTTIGHFNAFPNFSTESRATARAHAQELFLPPMIFVIRSPIGGIGWDTGYLGLYDQADNQKWGTGPDMLDALVAA